jgi:hypothetical protein
VYYAARGSVEGMLQSEPWPYAKFYKRITLLLDEAREGLHPIQSGGILNDSETLGVNLLVRPHSACCGWRRQQWL